MKQNQYGRTQLAVDFICAIVGVVRQYISAGDIVSLQRALSCTWESEPIKAK